MEQIGDNPEKNVLIISLKHTTVTERKHIVSDLADVGSNHTAFILHWTRINNYT